MRITVLITTALAYWGIAAHASDSAEHAAAFPVVGDPYSGNWTGQWIEGDEDEPDIAAQVIALGDDRYRVIIKHRLDVRSPPMWIMEGTPKSGVLDLSTESYYATIGDGRFDGGKIDSESKFRMTPAELASPTLGASAPRGATVLFDGGDLSAWRGTPGWNVTDAGTLLVTPGSTDLVTVQRFKDIQLHLEFRLPYRPSLRGQDRGNSGVYLHSAYEVQILDSFGLEGYYDECGALYKVAPPKVNACRPPLQWQTYDITYTAPRFSADGKLESFARVTVLHNGVLVHHNQELPWRTGGESKRNRGHPAQAQSLKLQEHEDYIEFRNIWLVEPKY